MRAKVSSKEKIIQAATEIIRSESVADCTARNISKKANIALGTIYNYFDSREALLIEVFVTSWKLTSTLLEHILNEDFSVQEKVIRMLETIEQDVMNRNGLGEYLFFNTQNDFEELRLSFTHLDDITKVFVELQKQCPSNKGVSEEVLEMNAQWIIFGHMSFNQRKLNIKLYNQQVVKKFFCE